MSAPFHIIIPARYGSTRLPGKPLRDIAGKPMIQRVYEQARQAGAAGVTVATDDSRIVDAVNRFGGQAVMTDPGHQSGTDRLQEVAQSRGFAEDTIVVNVQGDEPLIPPAVIRQVANNLATRSDAAVATLCEPIAATVDFLDPNIVKVVTDTDGYALYFSRASIPWPRDHFARDRGSLPEGFLPRRHLGLYAYRAGLLTRFVDWPPAPLEQLEALEQLRFLYNGARIHVADAEAAVPGGVDSETDLQRVIAFLEENADA